MTSFMMMSMTIPVANLAALSPTEREKYDKVVAKLAELLEAVARSGENRSSTDGGDHVFAAHGECSDATAVAVEQAAGDAAMAAGATVYLYLEHDGDMNQWVGPDAEAKSNDDIVNSVLALFNSLPAKWKRPALERLARRMPITFKAVAKEIK